MRSNCRGLLEYQIDEDGSSLDELKRYFTDNLGSLHSALNFLLKRGYIKKRNELVIKTEKGVRKATEIRNSTEIFFRKETIARQRQKEEVLKMYASARR